MIRVEGLVKEFRSKRELVRAVDSVSFSVQAGTFFTLLGPSGCGKTTTLRMLAGLETPTSGKIEIGGRVVYGTGGKPFVPPNQRNVGMVFQSYAIWPHMSVLKNVAYPLLMRGRGSGNGRLGKRERTAKAMRALELVGLQDLADRPAPRLSGGQQQRVALARAIVDEPDVLLLDEPLSNLDASLRAAMREELKSLQDRLGITTIFVTHDQDEALSMSDEVAVLSQGEIIQVGGPRDIYHRPASVFTARFIGTANMLPVVKVEAQKADTYTYVETDLGPVGCRSPVEPLAAESLFVCVRPEFVRLLDPGGVNDARESNVYRGVIERVVFMGARVFTRVSVGSTSLLAQSDSGDDWEIGVEVSVQLPPEHCILIAGTEPAEPEGSSPSMEPGDLPTSSAPAP